MQSYAFCDITKLQNAGLPVVRSQMDKIVLSRAKEIVEKGLVHLFITSRNFFNKTDFEQQATKAEKSVHKNRRQKAANFR